MLVCYLNSWKNQQELCLFNLSRTHKKSDCSKPWLWKTCSVKQKRTRFLSIISNLFLTEGIYMKIQSLVFFLLFFLVHQSHWIVFLFFIFFDLLLFLHLHSCFSRVCIEFYVCVLFFPLAFHFVSIDRLLF